MAKRVSELFDKEVYTLEGKFLGYADDFIFDDQLGSIVAIILATEKGGKVKTVPYENVRACADIYLVEL